MTNGIYQGQPMSAEDELQPSEVSLMYIDDDPTLPRLTMSNSVLVPVEDSDMDLSSTGTVPCQFYTVTSFCRNPKHLDLNYATEDELNWIRAEAIITNLLANKQKPKEIIHKAYFPDENENLPPTPTVRRKDRQKRISSARNLRASSEANLAFKLLPKNVLNLRQSEPRQIPEIVSSRPPQARASSVPVLRTFRRRDSSPTLVPIAPPRQRNNFSKSRSSSQSRENVQFQNAPPIIPPNPVRGNLGNSSNQYSSKSSTDFKSDLLTSQFAKKEKLRVALQSKQHELATLRRDVEFLRQQLEPLLRIEKLNKENERLQQQCEMRAAEVDSYTDGSVPLGETRVEFYRDRSPRQDGCSLSSYPSTPMLIPNSSHNSMSSSSMSRSPIGRLPTGSAQQQTRRIPPPRPPPPNSLRIPWECSQCTFRNHPDLNLCEQCGNLNASRKISSSGGSLNSNSPTSSYFY